MRCLSTAHKIDSLLARLDDGATPTILTEHGWRIHRLTGDRKGGDAVVIAGRWRLVFRFKDGDAYDVDVIKYDKS